MQRTFNKAERKPYFRNGSLGVDIAAGELWTPAAISTGLWLDAADDTTITLNGSTVSQWDDKSGNSNNATQATAGSQPAYVTNVLNNLNVVRFSSKYLSTSYVPATGADSRTIIAVAANVTYTGITYEHLCHYGTSFSSTNLTYGITTRTMSSNNWGNHYWANGFNTGKSSATNSIVIASYASGVDTFYINGDNGTTNTVALNTGSASGILLGTRVTPDEYGLFDLAEFIALPNTLSTSDRQKMEGYLAWKWGLVSSLPADHPYKNSEPTL